MRQMASSASVSAILIVAALVSVASATTEECRGVKVIQKIDMSMLRGVWYESHSMNLLSVAGPRQCHAAHFYPASDGNSFTILHDYVYYVGEQVLSGSRFGWNVTDEDPANDGHFSVEMALYFSEWIKATFVVMDTDYNNYAIIYVCQFTGDQMNLNGGMILTRKKLLDDDDSKFILSRIDDSYKRNFMSKNEFIPTLQNDCKEVFFPEYFPSNVHIGTPPAEVLFMPLDTSKPVTHHEHHVEPPPPAQPVEQPPPSTRLHQESPASFMPQTNNQQNSGLQDNSIAESIRLNSPTPPDRLLSQLINRLEQKAGFFEGTANPVGAGARPVGSEQNSGPQDHSISDSARLNSPTPPDRLLSQLINRLEQKAGFFEGTASPVGSGASTNVAVERPTTSVQSTSVTQVSSRPSGFSGGFMANLIAALGSHAGIWGKPTGAWSSESSTSYYQASSVYSKPGSAFSSNY